MYIRRIYTVALTLLPLRRVVRNATAMPPTSLVGLFVQLVPDAGQDLLDTL